MVTAIGWFNLLDLSCGTPLVDNFAEIHCSFTCAGIGRQSSDNIKLHLSSLNWLGTIFLSPMTQVLRPNNRPRRQAASAVLAACLLLAGCGAGEPLIPVEGTVTLAGKPLTEGSVSYRPSQDRGNESLHHPTGRIEADGSYRLYVGQRNGAPPGWYKVVVFANEPTPDDPDAVHPGFPQTLIDRRYNRPETTPLTVEVAGDTDQSTYQFDLEPAR